ncbi:MAG: hypothetical protein ABNH02_09420 [Pseudomonadales bacterium]|jgi:hypothetical protein
MNTNTKNFKQALLTLLSCLMLTGCPLDGDDGKSGAVGVDGVDGVDGINCWDTNSNRTNDPDEDINGDGVWDAKDCSTQIQSAQNPQVEFNHQHFCEAFALLPTPQYPAGCPSATHSPPTGTLFPMTAGQFDGTFNTCSDLSIVTKTDSTGSSVQAYWSLQGGYIGYKKEFYLGDRDLCRTECENDTDCVAAFFRPQPTTQAGECSIIYHSDTVQPYERICGVGVTTQTLTLSPQEVCLGSLSSQNNWWAICP